MGTEVAETSGSARVTGGVTDASGKSGDIILFLSPPTHWQGGRQQEKKIIYLLLLATTLTLY
jgi:hypothetical protein